MNPTPFSDFLKQSKCILGEGAVIERLRRNPDCELDAHIVNSGFIYHATQRAALAAICGSTWTSASGTICRCSSPPPPGVPAGSGSRPPVYQGWT